jgi:Fe-S cluster assembly iron-binding protein IscA
MYYLRTKAASAAIKFTVKKKVEKIPDDEAFKLEDANVKVAVKEQLETMADDEAFKTEDTAVKVAVEVAKKPAVKSVNIDYTPEEILACSIDNPDDCEACGS